MVLVIDPSRIMTLVLDLVVAANPSWVLILILALVLVLALVCSFGSDSALAMDLVLSWI